MYIYICIFMCIYLYTCNMCNKNAIYASVHGSPHSSASGENRGCSNCRDCDVPHGCFVAPLGLAIIQSIRGSYSRATLVKSSGSRCHIFHVQNWFLRGSSVELAYRSPSPLLSRVSSITASITRGGGRSCN